MLLKIYHVYFAVTLTVTELDDLASRNLLNLDCTCDFFKNKIYLFMAAARRLSLEAARGLLFAVVRGYLTAVASLVA